MSTEQPITGIPAPDPTASPIATPAPVMQEIAPVVEIASIPSAPTAELDTFDAPSAEAAQEAVKPALEPWPNKETALQEHEIFLPLPANQMQNEVVLAIPGTTNARTQQQLQALPALDYDKSPGGEQWGETLAQGGLAISPNDAFQRTVEREGSTFRQAVPSEKGPLAASSPRLKEQTEGHTYTGERAVHRIRSLLGLGSVVQIPLWHSGFWVTLKTPSDASMLELNHRLADEKILLGRMTHGLAFANTSVFFAGWLSEFFLAHVLETTLKPGLLEAKGMRERLKSPDLPILAWGMACAIWPKGFPYARAVIDKDGNETKVIRELVAVGKMLWTDTASLTDWQRGHMAQRFGQTMGEESLEKYQNEFTRGKGRKLELTDKVSLMLKVPSLTEYINAGNKWINNIVTMVDKAFGMPPGSEERNQFILDQGKASYMRQYAHWVESVIIDENNQSVVDVETVEQVLDAMSGHDELRTKYFKGIQEFIEDSTVSLVAIPATEDTDVAPLPRFPHLLPIDAMSVFFILLVQKVTQIHNR